MRTFLLTVFAAAVSFGQAGPAAVPFVPDNFNVPTLYETATYKLVPLGPDLAKHDYDAYMSSIEHLRKTFSSGRWPHENLTMDDARKDVEGEISRFKARRSFTYAVLTPDGSREMGCVYISPSPKEGYDAVLRTWVTQADFDKGFDEVLLKEMKEWVGKTFPFQKIALPKREIPMDEWQKLPNKQR